MKPWLIGSALCAAVIGLATPPAMAQDSGKLTKEALEKAFPQAGAKSDKPVDQTCEQQGMVTGPDGSCNQVLSGGSRGFSLGGSPAKAASSAAPAAAKPARPAGVRSASTAPAPVRAQAPARGDLLISFKLGSAEITPEGKGNAKVFAQFINGDRKDLKFEIAGHTDRSGAADRNQALSQARADAVKTYLVDQGVAADRLVAKGYGSEQLLVKADPNSPRNRRVEARVIN